MRPSEFQRVLPGEDISDAKRAALQAGVRRAVATVAVFATVYALMAAMHPIAPDRFPALTDWPLIAHVLLVGLGALTTLRDAIDVGRDAWMDALHSAYIRRTSRTGGAGDDR